MERGVPCWGEREEVAIMCKTQTQWGCLALVLDGQVVKYCLGQSEGFRIIRTAYEL